MSELEEKLGTILSNPQLMQQIASMAQALGQPAREKAASPPPAATPPALPDPAMLQNLSGFMQAGHIDQEQQALLKALGPYLTSRRIRKLENAMRAAKMARLAAATLGGNLF